MEKVKGNEFEIIGGLVRYIGVKIVGAMPMTRLVYNQFRSWNVPADENPDDLGYLVQYEGDGYVSWSPVKQFHEAYMETSGLTFGLAIEAMRKGLNVRRKGWNGKGIFIGIIEPTQLTKLSSPFIYIDTTGLITNNPDAPKSRVPWLASQTDMLALDWELT